MNYPITKIIESYNLIALKKGGQPKGNKNLSYVMFIFV